MSEATLEPNALPSWRMAWIAFPRTIFVSLATELLGCLHVLVAQSLTRAAQGDTNVGLIEASSVLVALSTVVNELGIMWIGLTIVFLLVSLPLCTREQFDLRFQRYVWTSGALAAASAAVLEQYDRDVAQRRSHLELLNALEASANEAAKELVARFEETSKGGVKATWICGGVFFLLSIPVALYFAVR